MCCDDLRRVRAYSTRPIRFCHERSRPASNEGAVRSGRPLGVAMDGVVCPSGATGLRIFIEMLAASPRSPRCWGKARTVARGSSRAGRSCFWPDGAPDYPARRDSTQGRFPAEPEQIKGSATVLGPG